MKNFWRSILPPKKKDWKEGDVQLGLFMRTEKGAKVEMTINTASPEMTKAAAQLLALMSTGLQEKNS